MDTLEAGLTARLFFFRANMREISIMVRSLALLVMMCVLALVAAAQGKPPTFSQYSVKVEKARIQAIDFKKNPDARTYKTRLIHGLEGGVNFAGHYIIVGWGCGTGCTNAAVIDTFTG